MSFINSIKENLSKVKATTKRLTNTTKDTMNFTKDSIRTIKEVKKIYDEFNGKAKFKTDHVKKSNNVNKYYYYSTNNVGPIIDVDFKEVK